MSIKKILSVATIVVVIVSALAVPVSAQSPAPLPIDIGYVNPDAPPGYHFVPFWSETRSAVARISASNRTITSTIQVAAHSPSTRISGTMFLERNVNGFWSNVQSWAVFGTGVLNANRTTNVSVGGTYRTRFVVFVDSERIERTSTSIIVRA